MRAALVVRGLEPRQQTDDSEILGGDASCETVFSGDLHPIGGSGCEHSLDEFDSPGLPGALPFRPCEPLHYVESMQRCVIEPGGDREAKRGGCIRTPVDAREFDGTLESLRDELANCVELRNE